MKKLLLSFLSLLIVAGVAFAAPKTEVLKLGEHADFNDTKKWANNYTSRTLEYDIAKVTFSDGGKQSQTITDCPVMKKGPVRVTFKSDFQVTHIKFNFKQWGTKKKTLSLETYDPVTDKNGTPMGITSSNFVIECDVNSSMTAVQVKMWNDENPDVTSNQVGLESIEITYEDGDTREEVTLSFPGDSYSAMLGREFVAPELAGAPEGAEIVYTSSDEAVATVAANGDVTLVGEGTTTITASFDGNDTYQPASPVSYTLKVVDPNVPVYLYKLVTDINDLNEGDIVTIACNSKGTVMTNMEVEKYREQKNAKFYNNNLYIDNDDEIMQLELGKNGSNWTFMTLNYKGTNGYIGNNAASNYCKINSTVSTGYVAEVTISATGDASIVFNNKDNNNKLKYNAGTPRFACYVSGQIDVQIYKLIEIAMPMAAPVVEVAVNDVVLFSEDGFDVVYAISQSDDEVPSDFEAYDEAIVLKQLQEGMNYIWAKTVVGPYESEAECIHVYENVDPEEGACIYTYNGVAPEDNCWVVIGAEVNGKHYFMGPDGKATLATVVENKFAGYASHFNNTISEYQHVGGALTVKAVSRAAANEGLTLEVADNGVATVANGDGVLGFDAEKKVFSTDAANKNLKVFATEGDINTGVDNVAVDGENAKVEYYNLQGVRVENPAKGGLYIKREGSKVSKVAL